MKLCPACHLPSKKVIYAGLPMRLCYNCLTLFGFWSWVVEREALLPFNGVFMQYEGSYLVALWHWATDDLEMP